VSTQLLAWIGFNAFILALLAVDLGVFHRKAHEVTIREALVWSIVWVVLALAFAAVVWRAEGEVKALEYLTGYLIERALSIDNLFVFILIFSYFRVPAQYQHRVLFWGILGALVMRGTMIAAGAYLISRFHWVVYVFGALLVITAGRMALEKTTVASEPKGLRLIALLRRAMPVTSEYQGARFFARVPGPSGKLRLAATPLFLVLVLVEASDLVFAVDSIPAIFAVTTDPFIIYTSNVFAILGLRTLYFLLADLIPRFRLLKPALSLVLAYVGVKMLISGVIHIPLGLSLGVIAGILIAAVWLSVLFPGPPELPVEVAKEGGASPPSVQRGRSVAATRRWSDPPPREVTGSRTP
jgi:tellurite resistance protein TerC